MNSVVTALQNLWSRASFPRLQGEAAEVERRLISQGYSFGCDIPALGARVYQKIARKLVDGERFIGQVWVYSGQIGSSSKDGRIELSLCVDMGAGDIGSTGKIGPWTFAEYLADPHSILNDKRAELNHRPSNALVCGK